MHITSWISGWVRRQLACGTWLEDLRPRVRQSRSWRLTRGRTDDQFVVYRAFTHELLEDRTALSSVSTQLIVPRDPPQPANPSTGNGDVIAKAQTPDGRYVLLESTATNLVTTSDTNGLQDVFVRDQKLGTTTLVSVNSSGTAAGNGKSVAKGISADGRFVLFYGRATNLTTTPDFNETNDVFVRDLLLQTTTLISINRVGTAAGYIAPETTNSEGSIATAISPNGRYVLFESFARDLSTFNITGGPYQEHSYMRDLMLGTTTLLSVNSKGDAPANGTGWPVAMSDDGRYVLLYSDATDLTATPDTNGGFDAFWRDRQTGITKPVNVNAAGTDAGNGQSNPVAITPDGRHVLFQSFANNLTSTPDTDPRSDVFVRDMTLEKTALVTVNKAGTGSANGFSKSASAISPDGRYVLFWSDADDLTAITDTNLKNDVFVRDMMAGATTLVSVNSAGNATGNNYSGGISLSPNGRFVLFFSAASNLTAISDTNGSEDMFLRDL